MSACPWCGKQDIPDGPSCPSCGQTLLVDVVLSGPLPTDRARFQAARALAALGPPAPAFAEAQVSLAKDAPVVKVSREFGQRVVAALASAGVPATVVAHTEAPPPRRGPFAMLAVAAVLLVVGGGLAWRSRHGRSEAPAPSTPVAQAPSDAGPVLIAQPSAPVTADARSPSAPLTTQQIAARVLPATARITCGDHLGAAFFIEPEIALTNAHVACPEGESQQVTLGDGRRLLGVTTQRDEWLDLARIRVVGAAATPVEIGDVTTLSPGDALVFVGSPRGLDFTLHEGKVSYVGRNALGVGYLQLNGNVNPGNSGGPAFDGRGRAVGIVSLKVMDAENIGLALPIQYAVPPTVPDAAQRWSALLERVAKENAEETKALDFPVGVPVVASTGIIKGLPVAVLVQSWDGPPNATVHRYGLEAPGLASCELRMEVPKWEALTKVSEELKQLRRLQWFTKYARGKNLFVGAGLLEVADCPGLKPVAARLVSRDAPQTKPVAVEAELVAAVLQVRDEQKQLKAVEREAREDEERRDAQRRAAEGRQAEAPSMVYCAFKYLTKNRMGAPDVAAKAFCIAGTVAQAQGRCDAERVRYREPTPCTCTDDKAHIGTACER